MDNLDVARVLQNYAEKVKRAKTTEQLHQAIKECKSELDLRKIKVPEWLN